VYFQYPKVLRHTCPVLGPNYHSLTQKTLHTWFAAVNSKACYWCYTCMLYFPYIILSCCRCRSMRSFVLWSEVCLLYHVLIGEILKSIIHNCSDNKSAFVSLCSPQTPTLTIVGLNLSLHGYKLLTKHLICGRAFASFLLLVSIGNYCTFVIWLVLQTLKWGTRLVDYLINWKMLLVFYLLNPYSITHKCLCIAYASPDSVWFKSRHSTLGNAAFCLIE